jgi:subtilisin family serine protease
MSLTSKLPGGRGTAVVLTTGLACVTAYAAVSSGLLSRAISAATTGKQATSISASKAQAAAAGGVQAGASIKHVGKGPQTYIVMFRDAPLATYKGGVEGIAAPARKGASIDAQSASALQYVDYLEARQDAYQASIEQALGRALSVDFRMQHALNAIVATMTPQEAEAVARMPDVALVDSNRHVPLDTDVGPGLIGATNVWAGIPRYFGTAASSARGEGVVVGIIDSGINFGSPSFAATDPNDGYVHVNPNGTGVFLGTCATGGEDAGRCNDKLIGGYDFVCGAPGNQCGVAGIREEPGFGDTNGHGSHTASTAAGNNRTQVFNGATVTFSGVAPRANVIAYDVCYTDAQNRGLCPGVSSAAAVNQAIQDGVDVINFSIGGGVSPWNDIVSQAFLNATEAGIFVAASAGNSGPGPATLGHVEPWTTASAAAQHGRGSYGFNMTVTGPTNPPPANLQAIALNPASGGVEAGPMPSTPVIVSPGIDTTNDGCAAFPAGTFTGAIAVVRRGTCGFYNKAFNAQSAGAVAVVIANNAAGALLPSVAPNPAGSPPVTVPAFGALQADANALRDYAAANPGVTASLASVVIPNVADALAAFSSRGPSNFDLLKPDITAPGVNVLAAYAGTTITGFENLITTISGTSMASPHTAGAAALMRQLHPTWTVMEIKSALQLTATDSVLLQDQVTRANPHAGGAGRVQVDVAARSSLVLGETRARFLAANPATGGSPAQLNLASLLSANCPTTCTFTRTVRSSFSRRHTWQVSATGLNMTVSPRTFTLNPGQTQQITVTVNNTGAPADGTYRFGRLEFSPAPSLLRDNTLPRLRMNVGVSVPAPPPPPTPITNGQAVSVSGAAGSNQYFSIEVPAGQAQLRVVTTGGTGDLDLYVRRGELPGAAFDCASEGGTNAETCTINAPVAGTFFIRIAGFTAFSGATLTASYP